MVFQQVGSSPLLGVHLFPFSQGSGDQDLGMGIPRSLKRRLRLKSRVETCAVFMGVSAWSGKGQLAFALRWCARAGEGKSMDSHAKAALCVKPHPSHTPYGLWLHCPAIAHSSLPCLKPPCHGLPWCIVGAAAGGRCSCAWGWAALPMATVEL